MDERYFSQNGEDFLLSRYFSAGSGVFVEVGCIDGKRFSNTYHFERRGWTGLCVEAHQGYIEMLKTNRPRSIVTSCAVAECDKDAAPFYANARGSLSSLDPTTEERWRRDYAPYFTGFQLQSVAQRTLTTLLKAYPIGPVDVLSLDVEGSEVQALQGLDLRLFHPSVILVESDSSEHERKIDHLLSPAGYQCALRYAGNLYYSILPDFQAAVAGRFFPKVALTHTRHPLDQGGDSMTIVDIDTRIAPGDPARVPVKPKGWRRLFGWRNPFRK